MEPARPRAGRDRDEGVPAPTSVRIQLSDPVPRCGIRLEIERIFRFFEMSGFKIFRKG
jgi:hypothetical protein